MSESAASWVILLAPFGCAGWYIYNSKSKDINNLVMCAMAGVLCLFGGFLFSGAVMKVAGGIDSNLITALLVCVGSAGCAGGHTALKKRKEKPE